MECPEPSLPSQEQLRLQWVPIPEPQPESPVSVCLLLQEPTQADECPFVLLREVPGSRVYLGGLCDAAGRVQEWLEIWVQEPELKTETLSSQGKSLDNSTFDRLWRAEFECAQSSFPESILVTGMESRNPRPLLIQRVSGTSALSFARTQTTPWQLCRDDELLQSLGLPPYATSCHRYLHEAGAAGKKLLLATSPDAPVNANVRGVEHLLAAGDFSTVFNPHAGLVRVTRFTPLELEEYLQVLEGRTWSGPPPLLQTEGIYNALAQWSAQRRGMAFVLHPDESLGQRLEEVFYLKLRTLLELVKAVRIYVKEHQAPLLNLGPASFRVSLPDVAEEFPALWGAKFHLVRPSQAYPLNIPLAKEKYFVRIGRVEASPFLPEGLGAYGFGIGSIRLRHVMRQDAGVILEGTLLAEDYVGANTHDLLWFKLPMHDQRLEFFANICTSEPVGPKEVRFRTVPTPLAAPLADRLKAAAGTVFQRSRYEICPLLSSPCDVFSLGIIGTRILLANSQSNLPVLVDEVLSLIGRIAKQPKDTQGLAAELKALATQDREAFDRISPQALIEAGDSPEQARAKLPIEVWWEAIAVLFRFFPGLGAHSFCPNLGEAAPGALETVFDQPVSELERLVRRLRNVLLPSVTANQELAQLLRDELTSP